MERGYLSGNARDSASPPHLFNGWLVGPLRAWADATEDCGQKHRKQKMAAACAQLSTDGDRADVELKFSLERTGATSQPGRCDKPGIQTLGLLIRGRMWIELTDLESGAATPIILGSEGDYLAWCSSYYNHRWAALDDSLIVTLRWSAAPQRSAAPG